MNKNDKIICPFCGSDKCIATKNPNTLEKINLDYTHRCEQCGIWIYVNEETIEPIRI